MNVLQAMDHPELWAGFFRNPETWSAWRTFLKALFGLQLDDTDLDLYRRCTGRSTVNALGHTEAWLVVGRRGGKSRILATTACFLACFKDWRPYLAPGEVRRIAIIATDKRQAKVIFRYCRALLTKVPAFEELIDRETDDEIYLTNGIAIEVQSASFRSVRGHTVIAALCDELAYWFSSEDSSSPDIEIINALRPAMATVPGAFFLAASSPYARRGELWRAYRQHWANDNSEVLCWHAATRTMNPTVNQRLIDNALEEDPARGAAEYLAEFRSDLQAFVSREVVEAAIVSGRRELPYRDGIRYAAFVDPSGASADSMTLAIGHKQDGAVVIDAIRERTPPFSPESVVNEFCGLIKQYKIREITGDRYAGEWPREQFRKNGIEYKTSEHSKSGIYVEFLPLLNSGRVELLDHPKLTTQLCALERRTGRGTGRDSIDHAPGGHDDIVNAVAGCAVICETVAPALKVTDAVINMFRRPLGSSMPYVPMSASGVPLGPHSVSFDQLYGPANGKAKVI